MNSIYNISIFKEFCSIQLWKFAGTPTFLPTCFGLAVRQLPAAGALPHYFVCNRRTSMISCPNKVLPHQPHLVYSHTM